MSSTTWIAKRALGNVWLPLGLQALVGGVLAFFLRDEPVWVAAIVGLFLLAAVTTLLVAALRVVVRGVHSVHADLEKAEARITAAHERIDGLARRGADGGGRDWAELSGDVVELGLELDSLRQAQQRSVGRLARLEARAVARPEDSGDPALRAWATLSRSLARRPAPDADGVEIYVGKPQSTQAPQ